MAKRASSKGEVETLKRQLAHRDELIAQLVAEIARLNRVQYGRSSERFDPTAEQVQLALDDLRDSESTEDGSSSERPAPQSPCDPTVVPMRRAPRAFPKHLPREDIVHQPSSCQCESCGTAMRKLGEDISEVLDFVPSYIRVLRHIRPKLSCPKCSTVVQAPAPSRPIDRGMASASLLAHVAVSKFSDHIPLYRQSQIFRRAGIELERATLAAWMGQAARLIRPLVETIGRYVLDADKVHADDTPFPVLDPGRGKTKTGRHWTYVRDDRPAGSTDPPAVWYQFSPNRKGEHPREHLRTYQGILQADGYAGYAPMYKTGGVTEAACIAHARRKYYDLYMASRSPVAEEALRRFGLLYDIEAEIRGQSPEVRRAVRQARAVPILEALHRWMETMLQRASAKSALAKAIKYSLSRWTALTRYCDDGRIDIDNNTAERSIRSLVLGRRNYLFVGSDTGGDSAAALYTLIGTAKLNGIEPYAYLRAVFERIADHPVNRIDELLPWRISLDADGEQKLAA